jgi:hypothetical protein
MHALKLNIHCVVQKETDRLAFTHEDWPRH